MTGIRAEDENRMLENKVFFELLRHDYYVYTDVYKRQAFLISPYGLPMAAAWLTGKIGGLNYALRDFLTS